MKTNKLEKLTKEQESKLEVYRDLGLKEGLSTDRMDKNLVNKAVNALYTCASLTPPKKIIYAKSPIEMVQLTLKERGIKVTKESFREELNNICYGSNESYWIKFYEFFKNECDIKNLESLDGLSQMQHCGWYIPYSNFIVISEKPTEIHMKDKVLHKDLGPAILFEDGFAVYALNGIKDPTGEFVMKEAKDIDVASVMKIENVDLRREVLRKIGLDRFIKDAKAVELDRLSITVNNKKCLYLLLDIDLGDGVKARVLKMDNPSIDAIHVEGVEDTCNTVKEALAWRNGFDSYTKPLALT